MPSLPQIRQNTAITPDLIHFNNAGGSLPTQAVTTGMVEYLTEEGRVGAYEIARDYKEQLDNFYIQLARYLNCRPENIARAGSATEAFDRGLSSIDWQPGDIVLTTKSDYVSNHLYFLQLAKKRGVKVEILPEGVSGYDPERLAKRLATGPLPRLVSITHVPTNSGRAQDIIAAGRLCRQYDVLYAVDACQSAGQLPLDVNEIACDFLSATFRKYMRGPRGIGFLYVSDRVLAAGMEPTGMDLQGARWTAPDKYELDETAARFEMWESSKALQTGAALATEYLNEVGIDFIQKRVIMLANRLSVECGKLPFLREHCYFVNQEEHQTGILLFDVDTGLTAAETVAQLQQGGLNASTSGIANDQFHFREQGVEWALRLSVHYYNTEEEVLRAVEILKLVLGG
ncbi:aminotransferase [Lewinellaceae bacterium SD302]|nr:aminotransferase [Lewinellaceae bacterium SD302]